jgi:hypothetical protein
LDSTSETSGYFLTPSETLINSIVSSNSDTANSAFKASLLALNALFAVSEFDETILLIKVSDGVRK